MGYRIDSPLPPQPIFGLIAERGGVGEEEMYEVFNMGCGFVVVVPEPDAADATALLARRHPGAAVIGSVTDRPGQVERA